MSIGFIFTISVIFFVVSAFLLLGTTAADLRKQATMKRLKALRGTPEARAVAVTSELVTEEVIPDFVPIRAREWLADWITSTRQIYSIRVVVIMSSVSFLLILMFLLLVVHLPVIVSLLGAIAVGIVVPYFAIVMKRERLNKKFLELFPDAIELMVRAIRAGLPISAAMDSVGKEIADPVGKHYRLLVADFRVGNTFDEALKRASERVQLMEFSFFTASLSLQNETGGNLAETLETLATVLRRRKEMRLKVNAITSEARTSAYVMAAIPFFVAGVLILINPKYMSPLLHDPRGGYVIAAALLSMTMGFGSMQVMIRNAMR